ncbi:unnamed protein product [Somion occarium]|uniref:F-box domain-containing protein n=1 Tax=Somion occarium TaxID=3059160 RepID=A0ABP1EBQ5_9APHY
MYVNNATTHWDPTKHLYFLSVPRLPTEIAERAIDSIGNAIASHYNDTRECRALYGMLFNCALTCKAWRPRSYFNLYHWLRLDDIERRIDASQRHSHPGGLIETLRTRPELLMAVRALASYQYSASEAAPVMLLVRLPMLQALRLIDCNDTIQHKFFFKNMSSLANKLTMLTLRGMKIDVGDFRRLLHILPRLSFLEVNYDLIKPSTFTQYRTLRPLPTCLLRSLIITFREDGYGDSEPGAVATLYDALAQVQSSISRLVTLRILISSKWDVQALQLIRQASSMLEMNVSTLSHLILTLGGFDAYYRTGALSTLVIPVDTLCLDKLQSLDLVSMKVDGRILSHLTQILSATASTALEDISIYVSAFTNLNNPDTVYIWQAFDGTLNSEHFPRLRKVSILCNLLEASIGELLPRCLERGILVVYSSHNNVNFSDTSQQRFSRGIQLADSYYCQYLLL